MRPSREDGAAVHEGLPSDVPPFEGVHRQVPPHRGAWQEQSGDGHALQVQVRLQVWLGLCMPSSRGSVLEWIGPGGHSQRFCCVVTWCAESCLSQPGRAVREMSFLKLYNIVVYDTCGGGGTPPNAKLHLGASLSMPLAPNSREDEMSRPAQHDGLSRTDSVLSGNMGFLSSRPTPLNKYQT